MHLPSVQHCADNGTWHSQGGGDELKRACHSVTFAVEFTPLPILLAHCSGNSLSGAEVTVVVRGKRETHLCLHDRSGLRDPAVAAAPSAPVNAVPSEALANLFPV